MKIDLFVAACCVLTCLIASASFAQSDDVATLPKVVLVGDSIRLSYSSTVAKELAGVAVVVSPAANGGDSNNVLKNVERWVIREKPAVVQFNCGIHDTKKFRARGNFQVSPEDYAANLCKIVQRIRAETDAVILFATTTPIVDDRAAAARKGRDYELLDASVSQYNKIAVDLMKELKVPVNDLNGSIANAADSQTTKTLIGSDGVHLTAAGRELLGKQVAALLAKSLPSTLK
jgi:lysophospholipase L1-like esterase